MPEGLTGGTNGGIISYRDSGNVDLPAVVDVIPRIDYFENEELNNSLNNAAGLLLGEARKHTPGTEFAYIISAEPPYSLSEPIIGEEGAMAVKIPRCSYPAITLHNHPSGEFFSELDIDKFVVDENAKAMCVIGNNGNWYILEKTESFDWYDYEKSVLNISDREDYAELVIKGADKYGFRYYEK